MSLLAECKAAYFKGSKVQRRQIRAWMREQDAIDCPPPLPLLQQYQLLVRTVNKPLRKKLRDAKIA